MKVLEYDPTDIIWKRFRKVNIGVLFVIEEITVLFTIL